MSDKNDITIGSIESLVFDWSGDVTSGITAQEIDMLTSTTMSSSSNISPQTITITGGALGSTLNSTSGIITTSSNTGFATYLDPYTEMSERLDRLEKLIVEEELVRKTHPAVQTAYDHYRLLLVLAGKISPEDLAE